MINTRHQILICITNINPLKCYLIKRDHNETFHEIKCDKCLTFLCHIIFKYIIATCLYD